jgi:2-polyprenyl-3-methyl-5-hydroxy-6-metoxy-1,4-benzoquinol methylase
MQTWGEYLAFGVLDTRFGDDSVEKEVKFSSKMYPNGINADFVNVKGDSSEDFLNNYLNKFNVPENRDIANCASKLMDIFKAHSNLGHGSSVIDFGCGTGLFLPLLSAQVGSSGLVLATEISAQFCTYLNSLIETQGLSNARVVPTTNQQLNLTDYEGTIDTVIICDVYHHLDFPKTMMRQIRKALKPETGRLIVVDFIRDIDIHKSHPDDWILQHV